jgi:hypothetical protein
MNGAREGPLAPVADPSGRGASLAAKGRPAEAAALQRLEASRARIRAAMEAHLRESVVPQDAPRGAPRPLGQRLLERVQRLPIVRTALAIRGLLRD